MSLPKPEPKHYKVLAFLFGAVILGYIAFQVFCDDDSEKPNFPAGGPAKFLYLDGSEVASYLAQVNGGSFDSETVTRKLTQSIGGKLTIAGAEANRSRANEIFVERVLQPTDASAFFALESSLDDQDAIEEIRLRYFENDVRGLEEGQFVSFKSSSLLSPLYLNAYLAVRQANTLQAIFPRSSASRKAARKFFEDVGKRPRVVFAIQPTDPTDPKRKRRKPFVYLLPMSARELTSERSLIKYGGGSFTVVGKLARRFPERYRDHDPAYVDSATLETWSHPLLRAPGELLCRTEPRCITRVRSEALTGRARAGAAEAARARILAALHQQTELGKRGAVILPVAIYK
jgi:hypothetical protein